MKTETSMAREILATFDRFEAHMIGNAERWQPATLACIYGRIVAEAAAFFQVTGLRSPLRHTAADLLVHCDPRWTGDWHAAVDQVDADIAELRQPYL